MIAKYLATLLANGCTFSIEPIRDLKPIGGVAELGTYVEVTINDGKVDWAISISPDLELGSAVERCLAYFIRNRNWPICERL